MTPIRVETILNTNRRVKIKTRDKDLVKIKDNRAESNINQKMLKITIHQEIEFKVADLVVNNTNRNKEVAKETNNIIRKASKINQEGNTLKDRICKAETKTLECNKTYHFCLTSKISRMSIRVNSRSFWWMFFKYMDQSWQLSLLDKMAQDREVFKPFFRAFNRSNNNRTVNSSSNRITEETTGTINKSSMVANSKINRLT